MTLEALLRTLTFCCLTAIVLWCAFVGVVCMFTHGGAP